MYTLAKIRNFFVRPRLSVEAFEAYFHRLPDTIEVYWERDNGMIVGRVVAGDREFYTQGKNPRDFIDMVNDALYTVYDIPFDYIEAVSKIKAFHPTKEASRDLYDGSISASDFSVLKNKKLHLA